jgi:hypothetical protein
MMTKEELDKRLLDLRQRKEKLDEESNASIGKMNGIVREMEKTFTDFQKTKRGLIRSALN